MHHLVIHTIVSERALRRANDPLDRGAFMSDEQINVFLRIPSSRAFTEYGKHAFDVKRGMFTGCNLVCIRR